MSARVWKALPRAEVIKAVERRHPCRVPVLMAKWWGEDVTPQFVAEAGRRFERFEEDVALLWLDMDNYGEWGLPWQIRDSGARDSRLVIDDWDKLDEFIAHLPDPESDPRFEALAEQAEFCRQQDRYTLFAIWRLFFERPWAIRGMQNLLLDYFDHPDEVHRLHEALCNLYCGYLRRAIRDLRPDGFWTSDDLGHQTGLFMRPQTFRAFLKPYYARIGELLRANGLHWWLHSCGNNTAVMSDLAEVGLNVFHPVQKHTMDEAAIAREYGDRLAFLAGFDVQHTLTEGTPEDVRREVRFLIDTFDRPDGGLCLAAGNGILGITPMENIEAFLDEAYCYGEQHRQAFAV